jgi:membrane-associated phospholipid phosphatase
VNRAAQVISGVFHPLLMTTYLFIILSVFLPSILLPLRASWWFTILIFGLTFFLPAMNFLFFKVSGTIKDLTMVNRTDRLVPFSFISILYGVVTLMFYWKFPVPGVLKLMMIVTALVIISALITLFYKLSIHSAGIWGIIGILLPLNKASEEGVLLIPTLTAIVIAGLVMSARLQLNAHIPREVLVGAIVGFAIGFGGIAVFF